MLRKQNPPSILYRHAHANSGSTLVESSLLVLRKDILSCADSAISKRPVSLLVSEVISGFSHGYLLKLGLWHA